MNRKLYDTLKKIDKQQSARCVAFKRDSKKRFKTRRYQVKQHKIKKNLRRESTTLLVEAIQSSNNPISISLATDAQ
jgi:hypothetical protein